MKYFFLLVFVLSVPFWLVGGSQLPIPVNLPVSALMFVVPGIAASILTCQQSGIYGIRELYRKAFDSRKIANKVWYIPILLLSPFIYSLSYVIMRVVGMPLPDPQIPLLMAPVFAFVYFIAALSEELGWMGYAFDPMQKRWGAIKASVILGTLWALWHVIPHRQQLHPASWIVWKSLNSIGLRILIAWIYNKTGKSVFAATLVHTMDSVSWSMFPNYGSHYNPFVTGVITWLMVGIIAFIRRSTTSARYQQA